MNLITARITLSVAQLHHRSYYGSMPIELSFGHPFQVLKHVSRPHTENSFAKDIDRPSREETYLSEAVVAVSTAIAKFLKLLWR
jgi:hypothetical protein